MSHSRKVFFGLVLLASQLSYAFPEMIRHGYVNCTSCHVSPGGGGVLTEYGHELSKELLSTWSRENESKFVWGILKQPAWLNMGGDFRDVFLYQDTQTFRQLDLILMQADIEANLKYQKFDFVGTFGYKETKLPTALRQHMISRRHYLMAHLSDEISFRAGRFQPVYGLGVPDHAVSIKRGLGWDQEMESYNLEGAYVGEKANFYFTGILGRPDATELKREKGFSTQFGIPFMERYKVGGSLFYGQNELEHRTVYGPWAQLGLLSSLVLLSEFDFQSQVQKNSVNQFGWVTFEKLDYEWFQGLHTFVSHQHERPDFKNDLTYFQVFGVGAQWFPRPHFEFVLTYEKRDANVPGRDADWIYLMNHFYF